MSETTQNPEGLSTFEADSSTSVTKVVSTPNNIVPGVTDNRTNHVTLKADPGIDTQEMARFLGMAFGATTSLIEIAPFVQDCNYPASLFLRLNEHNGSHTSDGSPEAWTPRIIAEAAAKADADGLPHPGRRNDTALYPVTAWYVRMTTLASQPAGSGRGGAKNISEVIGFWLDGDYGTLGHATPRKKSDLPYPPDAEKVREIWRAAGYPEPTITWHTGGGINGLWMFPSPLTIPEGPDGADLFDEIRKASDRWHTHVVRTAKGMGYKHDNTGNLDRIMRLPGSVNRKSDHAYDPKAVYADYTGATYTLNELMELIPQDVRPARQTSTQSLDGTQADGDTPWAAYNTHMWESARFRSQLTDDGWTHHSWSGQVENLTRPGKDARDGQSATFGHNDDPGHPKLFPFSDACPGLLGVPRDEGGFHWQYVDPHQYLAATQFAYDETTGVLRGHREALSACARSLRGQGFGASQDTAPEEDSTGFQGGDSFDDDQEEDLQAISLETETARDSEGRLIDVPTARARQARLALMEQDGITVPDEMKEKDQIIVRRASSYRPRKTEWAWDTTPEGATPTSGGRIPRDMLTLAAGLPGTGKSQWAIWVAAQLTRGTLPGCYYGKPMNVVYAATEDDWERTIVPRLIAAGADLDRILHAKVRTIEHKTVKLTVPTYAATLGEFCRDHEVAMVILDPLLSHIGVPKLNANAEKDIRDALEPLTAAASRYGFTVLGLSHFNKDSKNADPMERLMGSRGFSALLRALIVFAKDKGAEDDEIRYVLSQAKNNLGRTDMPSYAYTIATAIVETDDGDAYVSRFVLGEETTDSVEQVLQEAASGTEGGDRKEAEAWLYDFLTSPEQGGEDTFENIQKAATKAGITPSALKTAKKKLGVRSEKSGGPGSPWVWKLTEYNGPSLKRWASHPGQ